MKKALLLLLAVLIMAGCTETKEEEPADRAEIPLGSRLLVLEAEGLQLEQEFQPEGLDSLYKDTVYKLDAQSASITVRVRKLNNGDQFVMTRLSGKGTIKATISIPGADDYYMIDWTKDMPVREHNKVTGVDPTKPPVGLLRYTKNHEFMNELVMSHSFTSKELTELYGSGRESRLHELLAEKNTVTHSKEGVQFELTSERDQMADQWFLLADHPLFDESSHLNDWITFQKEHYKEVNNWFAVDGPMKKLPWSVEPFTKDGYGLYLGTMIEKEAIDRYFRDQDRYFYDLTVQSAANLWTYRTSRNDVIWKTEFTSTWLKQKYDITAPYVDTRHNELIALYLHRIGKELGVPELEAALTDYSDYLLKLISIDNIVPAEKGYYPADYYSPQQGKQFIHASLNHSLGEANMFIKAYKETKEKKYLLAARNIRQAVESTGEKWIRPNGDLWYQINRDGTFDGGDYELLTLYDLRRHEKNWKQLGGKPSPILQKLIESKEQYLNSK
ncbi:hypothetical protein RG959_05255 [Domibacillus sp. 8LH]|uniref:hypothetical protein n=1 Tax=Domibacillus sp. 8LH TaxID=3073900 RepID=UPI00316D8A79